MPRPKSVHPTPGELEVLRVLWRTGPATVREVLEAMHRQRPRGYTSVMSLLNVMVDKGFLKRVPAGRAFRYAPRIKEQATLGRMVADLVDRAFGGSTRLLVAHALEQTDLSDAELAELRKLLDKQARAEDQP